MEIWNWLLANWADIGMAASLLANGVFAVMTVYAELATPNDTSDDEKVSRWKRTWRTWVDRLSLGGKR